MNKVYVGSKVLTAMAVVYNAVHSIQHNMVKFNQHFGGTCFHHINKRVAKH
jgi:hypothetical protein